MNERQWGSWLESQDPQKNDFYMKVRDSGDTGRECRRMGNTSFQEEASSRESQISVTTEIDENV